MKNPCLITVWPVDIFYPLFVHQINRDRELFGRVIVVMTPGNNPGFDFTQEIKRRIKRVSVITPDILKMTAGGKDWRNAAVNEGYKLVDSDYLLHVEQDFLAGKGFYKKLFEEGDGKNAIGFLDGNRFHPACLLVKKEATEKTSKDYSAYPPAGDHFAAFSQELMELGSYVALKFTDVKDAFHISGLTHNFRIEDPRHRIDEFYTYVMGSDHELLDQPDQWRKFNLEKMAEVVDGRELEIVEEVMKFFKEVK